MADDDDDNYQQLEVEAPSDLEGGYLLDVELNGEVRTVIVPDGGVQMGETFVALVLPRNQSRRDIPESAVRKSNVDKELFDSTIPTGQWRDGFCDCCKYYAPVCCMGYWCGLVILGQVMTRLHLNWCSQDGLPPSQSNTFSVLCSIFLVYFIIGLAFYCVLITKFGMCMSECINESNTYWWNWNHGTLENFEWSTDYCAYINGWYDHDTHYSPNTLHNGVYSWEFSRWDVFTECSSPGIVALVFILLGIALVIDVYRAVIMCQTRKKLREKYRIHGNECEDCAASFFCSCCTVTQMARHTHDYHEDPVACCSQDCLTKTGRPV